MSEFLSDQGLNVALKVRDLDFYYGGFKGLKSVSMDIAEKKVTAFIGPSGCGKSTLLRTFNRMYDLYPGQRAEGQINLYGENILDPKQDLNLLRARVGMVFQKPTPFPMSIYDNIAFGVKLYENLSRSEMDDRVEWALSKAAIWNEVKDKLGQSGLSLSGGQQQRLCIARTVAVKPDFRTVGVLAGIVLLRTFLSYSLQLEVTGYWPWQNAKAQQAQRDKQAATPT